MCRSKKKVEQTNKTMDDKQQQSCVEEGQCTRLTEKQKRKSGKALRKVYESRIID